MGDSIKGPADGTRSRSARLLPAGLIAVALAATGCSVLDRTEVGTAVAVTETGTPATTAPHSPTPAAATETPAAEPLAKPALPGEPCGTATYPQTGSAVVVFVDSGSITCANAFTVFDRYLHDPNLVHGGNTWFTSFDGWGCSSPTAARAQETGNSGVCENTGSGIRIVARPAVDRSPVPRRAVDGDLGLATPMTVPACDGTGIVVLANATEPTSYRAEIERYLATYPGASYLRTDRSCSSLRQADDHGNAIYAVYRVAGRSPDQVCEAVRTAGGGAYGKWLDATSNPTTSITC
ncbi:hypothetical protein [Prescottella agglutinans]|uniref:Serine/threonine protein kinase n=1 Tax=Prescottella agglutinans TaxID=1644129 RepID=A0ABT6MEH7_9NOCA|nr:hypothetical protein [Prescottella agglutinans]MDH6282682.1 hypothetical protein [Prescottella agglutinans]